MSEDRPALVLRDVTKRFGRHVAVNRISLEVPRGVIHGVLGPNGAGKTTTIRMIMSILLPDSGSIEVLGVPDAASVKDRLGYLPEEKGLYKKMKAAEIVAFFGRLKGLSRREAKRRAVEMLDRFGLGEWKDAKCEALSKGMGQKVQVLGTLLHEPDLVILDEPFSGLDPVNREVVHEMILDIARQGRTVLFSTHVMEQAERICDSVVLIHQGRKVLDGPLAQVRRAAGRAVRLDYEGESAQLEGLPGVTNVRDEGQSAELSLEDGADEQAVLRALVDRVRVRRFDVTDPSLHDVFIRTVTQRHGAEAAAEVAAAMEGQPHA